MGPTAREIYGWLLEGLEGGNISEEIHYHLTTPDLDSCPWYIDMVDYIICAGEHQELIRPWK